MSIKINGKPMGDYIKEQMKKGEVLENVCGTQNFNGFTNVFRGGSVMNVNGDFLLTNNASLTVNRNGKRYHLKGNRIERRNGQWYVDGKAVDWKELGGKFEDEQVVKIEITGTVQNLHTTMADVVVHGDCQNIKTGSGDVQCENAMNVFTGSGDVHCGDVGGMVSTGSGDVYRK